MRIHDRAFFTMQSISYEFMDKMMQIDVKIMGIDKDLKEIWCFSSEHLCENLGNPTSKGRTKKGRGRQRGNKGRGIKEGVTRPPCRAYTVLLLIHRDFAFFFALNRS